MHNDPLDVKTLNEERIADLEHIYRKNVRQWKNGNVKFVTSVLETEALVAFVNSVKKNQIAVKELIVHAHLKDKEAAFLVNSLGTPDLESIDLSRNNIRHKGMKSLGEELAQLSLKHLNLAVNSMGRGTPYLVNLLRKDCLETLDLSCNRIEDDFFEALVNPLKERPLTRLHYLNLRKNYLGIMDYEGWMDVLGAVPLVRLNLAENDMTAEAASCLISKLNPETKILNLSKNPIGKGHFSNTFYKALEGTALKVLDLSYCGINDKGLKKLIEALANTELTTLNLSGNSLTADGFLTIKEPLQKTQLKKLIFNDMSFKAADIVALMRAIKDTTISVLVIEEDSFDGSLAERALGKFLQKDHVTILSDYDSDADSAAESDDEQDKANQYIAMIDEEDSPDLPKLFNALIGSEEDQISVSETESESDEAQSLEEEKTNHEPILIKQNIFYPKPHFFHPLPAGDESLSLEDYPSGSDYSFR
ncbi:MAG: hypothetical protein H2069_01175 [Legionella sp.]|nr:hypothetical protein [Legionella sp.]